MPGSGRGWRRAVALLALAAGLGLGAAGGPAEARQTPDTPVDSLVVRAGELPAEARSTERLIRAGGPFPYAKDGTVFGNRERLLPRKARGYYREYTVRTPGARNRGARRIVCGGEQPTVPDACYYTEDHYASFRRIVQ
ncbi:ribonuclease domain-containing protein [Piscinibacter sakaiensis]|uniref:Guanine-specific ribonuclease N1 and T1 n=1 Tax=Piscinibacter sakaiensis TaxID=1547922 RepID=A0A0K8P7W8_PISS1|nr:guanine-specific ribonuclease N1 and T1 precursor [Piscinibacter sakaiensis]